MPAPALTRSRACVAVTALALVTALAGCGGDDDESRTATVSGAAPIEVVADEYSFDPQKLIVEAAGGGRAPLELRLENDGSLAHNLKVLEGDDELGGTPAFEGGETRSGRVELRPGRYRMVCTVGDHEELGMTGTLEVRVKKPPSGGG